MGAVLLGRADRNEQDRCWCPIQAVPSNGVINVRPSRVTESHSGPRIGVQITG